MIIYHRHQPNVSIGSGFKNYVIQTSVSHLSPAGMISTVVFNECYMYFKTIAE